MDKSLNVAEISDLSHELLCNILKNLPIREILSVGMLSKKLYVATKMHFRLCKSIDFCPSSVNGYMPSSITDEHLLALLKRCPQLETIYGLHPVKVERRRQRKRSSLTVPGIIEALNLCPFLKAIETCDLRLLEAIMHHLPLVEIIGYFQNRDGAFPPQASQKLKLQNYARITSLHLIGVEVIELTAMPQLKHLHLHCVRFLKQQPFRAFLALNLRTFVMKHCIGPVISLRYLSLIIALSTAQNLNHLELVRVPFHGGSFYRAVEDTHGRGFVNLKTLVFSSCKGVLESDLGHLMIVSSKNLETLYIQPSLTKDSLFVSLSFAQCRFPSLRNLHLGYIDTLNVSGEWSYEILLSLGLSEIPDTPSSITDSGMNTVGQLLPNIKSLSVSNCPHLMTMYQWISSVDVPSWTELTDLILQKCHCLQLSSFTAFVSIVPRLQVIILYEMFKEPPKGCSHVGLSAGTGLGMSSAVVSNQDEHLAVHGHPVQDFDHPGEEDNLDELNREILEAENDENLEPRFMFLHGDFFEDDDDIDYVNRENENRCINEALRQQDGDMMFDMMNVSSNGSSDTSDVDELVNSNPSLSQQSDSKNNSCVNANRNKDHCQSIDCDFQQSSKSVCSQTSIGAKQQKCSSVSDYDPLNASSIKTETLDNCKSKNSMQESGYDLYKPSTSNTVKSVNNKNGSSSNISCYDPHKPSTSKAGNTDNCKSSSSIHKLSYRDKPSASKAGKSINIKGDSSSNVSDYDPHKPSTSKAGNFVNYKSSSSKHECSYDPYKPSTSKAEKSVQSKSGSSSNFFSDLHKPLTSKVDKTVNSKSDSSLNVSGYDPHKPSTSKAGSHLDCSYSKSSNITRPNDLNSKKSKRLIDNNLPKPLASNSSCISDSPSYKEGAKRSLPQRRNISKKEKLLKMKNINEHNLKRKADDVVDNFVVNNYKVECPIEHHSESNSPLKNVCKPCYVPLTKLDDDILATNKNLDEQKYDSVLTSTNVNYRNSIKEKSENFVNHPTQAKIIKNNRSKILQVTDKIEDSQQADCINLLNNEDQKPKIKSENDNSEQHVPQWIPGSIFERYTNSVRLPNTQKIQTVSRWYHPHLGTITEMPSTRYLLGNNFCGGNVGTDDVNADYAEKWQKDCYRKQITEGRSPKKSLSCKNIPDHLHIDSTTANAENRNSLAHSSKELKSGHRKNVDSSKIKIASIKMQPSTSSSASFRNHNFKDVKPGTSRQSEPEASPEIQNKSVWDFSNAGHGTSNQSDPVSGDSNFHVVVTNDSRFPNKCFNSLSGDYFNMMECKVSLTRVDNCFVDKKAIREDRNKLVNEQFVDTTAIPSTSRMYNKDHHYSTYKKTKKNSHKRRKRPLGAICNKKQKMSIKKDCDDNLNLVEDLAVKWRKPSVLKITPTTYYTFAKTTIEKSCMSKNNSTCEKTEVPGSSQTQSVPHIKKKRQKTKSKNKGFSHKKIRTSEKLNLSNRASCSKTNSFLPTVSLVSQGTQANSADIRRSVRRVRLATVSARKAATSSSKTCLGRKSSKISAKMGFKRPKKHYTRERLDKATSTSDPLLEDDAIQVLKISCDTLISFSIIACGISDLIIDRCPKMIHLDVQACRILKKLEFNIAPSIKYIKVCQCPKLTIQELSQSTMTLVADSFFLVNFEPCMQAYHPGDGEKAILEKTRQNQTVMICHDFHELSDESIQAGFQDKMMKWLCYLTRLPATLKYTREKSKPRKCPIMSDVFPYQHEVRRIHGDYLGPPISEFHRGGKYQLFTNNRIISEAFETCMPDRGFPFAKDCETFKNSSLFSLEAMEAHVHMYKNMVGFYISITENNMIETYKICPVF